MMLGEKDMFREKRRISRSDVFKFIEESDGVTVRDIADHFDVRSARIRPKVNYLLQIGDVVKRGGKLYVRQ